MLGAILTAVGSGLRIAESIAQRAERGQLIDAGDARAVAKTMEDIHAQIAAFKAAADRVDADGDFARRVRDAYTLDE